MSNKEKMYWGIQSLLTGKLIACWRSSTHKQQYDLPAREEATRLSRQIGNIRVIPLLDHTANAWVITGMRDGERVFYSGYGRSAEKTFTPLPELFLKRRKARAWLPYAKRKARVLGGLTGLTVYPVRLSLA